MSIELNDFIHVAARVAAFLNVTDDERILHSGLYVSHRVVLFPRYYRGLGILRLDVSNFFSIYGSLTREKIYDRMLRRRVEILFYCVLTSDVECC